MEGQLWTYKTGTAGIPFWNSGGKIWVEFLINILLGRGLGHDRTKSVCRSRENGRLAHASFQNWHKAYCLDLSPSQSLRFQDSQGLSVNQLLHKYPIATSWVNNSFPVPITLTLCLQLGIHKLYHPLICHCSSPSLGDPSSSWYTWYSCFHNLSYFSFLGAKIQSFPQSSKSFLRSTCSRLFVPFCCRKKVLSFGNEKKNTFFFCISLAYSYLCTRKQN